MLTIRSAKDTNGGNTDGIAYYFFDNHGMGGRGHVHLLDYPATVAKWPSMQPGQIRLRLSLGIVRSRNPLRYWSSALHFW